MKIKMQDIRTLNDEDLLNKHQELKKELFSMSVDRQLKRADRPARFGFLRRQIAQILTVVNERKNKSHGTKTQ